MKSYAFHPSRQSFFKKNDGAMGNCANTCKNGRGFCFWGKIFHAESTEGWRENAVDRNPKDNL